MKDRIIRSHSQVKSNNVNVASAAKSVIEIPLNVCQVQNAVDNIDINR